MAISKAWNTPAAAECKRAYDVMDAHLGWPGARLATYQTYNSNGLGALVFRSDMVRR